MSGFSNFCKKLPRAQSRGFTLIEMMVVLGIFVIITGVVLANLPAFRDKTSLDLVAEEVALAIRQAQVFGTGTRSSAGTASFPSYGVYFSPGDGSGGRGRGGGPSSPTTFVLFADAADDGQFLGTTFDCDGTDECQEKFTLSGGVVIDSLLGCSEDDEDSCGDTQVISAINVVFNRPEFDAIFNPDNGYALVKIILRSPVNNQKRRVVVWSTGHIYVEQG